MPASIGANYVKQTMPLHKIINVNSDTQIFIWKITESYQQLSHEVKLNNASEARVNGMKSESHRRGFLSVRKLLQQNGYSDFNLYYDAFGKPHLTDGNHLSITHSHEFSAVVFSNCNIGIDIEKQRDKIIRIADKFIFDEFRYLEKANVSEYISKLTVIWGIKEAIFKIRNEQGISFKDHIKVQPFDLVSNKATAVLEFDKIIHKFSIIFETIENFILVYAVEN